VGFEVIPSIDILNGECVRLAQGSYQDVTVMCKHTPLNTIYAYCTAYFQL